MGKLSGGALTMSFPINISFKDDEFNKIQPAAARENKSPRRFVKDCALEKADQILSKKSVP